MEEDHPVVILKSPTQTTQVFLAFIFEMFALLADHLIGV